MSKYFNHAKKVWSTMFRTKETPRELREKKDLYFSLLAINYRNLRCESLGLSNDVKRNCTNATSFNVDNASRTDMFCHTSSSSLLSPEDQAMKKDGANDGETLVDKATSYLIDTLEIHEMSNKGMRYELQKSVETQILSLFDAFKQVDETIPESTLEKEGRGAYFSKENAELAEEQQEHEEFCRSILLSEYNNLNCKWKEIVIPSFNKTENIDDSEVSHDTDYSTNVKNSRLSQFVGEQIPFVQMKLNAIKTLADFYKWNITLENEESTFKQDEEDEDDPDAFGYVKSKNQIVNNAIRYHQMRNLTKSFLLKQRLGYSIIALKSNIQNAGRGIYVDGYAPAGSLLAFFPGSVWPKEHLMAGGMFSTSTSVSIPSSFSIFKNDPNYHLSLRYDDILVDSRNAPYTVLDDNKSNPFAIAHIANHPSSHLSNERHKLDRPNCHTIPLNFTDSLNLKGKKLNRFIPNTYAKQPMFLGPGLFEKDRVLMYGMGLLASRDVCNEELIYDYRLSPGSSSSSLSSYPDWYTVFDEEELQHRWHDQPQQ